MYAIFEDSGTQIKVNVGDIVDLDARPVEPGTKQISFDKVLAVGTGDGTPAKLGMPYLAGKSVEFKVLEADIQDDKVMGAKWKRRKRYLKVFGHRQRTTQLEVTKIG